MRSPESIRFHRAAFRRLHLKSIRVQFAIAYRAARLAHRGDFEPDLDPYRLCPHSIIRAADTAVSARCRATIPHRSITDRLDVARFGRAFFDFT